MTPAQIAKIMALVEDYAMRVGMAEYPTRKYWLAIEAALRDAPQQAEPTLTDEQIKRHSLLAADCPGASTVILVSSLRRLLAAAPTEAKPAKDAVDAEPKSLNAKIADQLRPFLKPGDKVIWREAFRWHDDNGVMPNHYDGMSIAGLADEFGYRFDWDFNMNHAAIIQGAALNASKEQP